MQKSFLWGGEQLQATHKESQKYLRDKLSASEARESEQQSVRQSERVRWHARIEELEGALAAQGEGEADVQFTEGAEVYCSREAECCAAKVSRTKSLILLVYIAPLIITPLY